MYWRVWQSFAQSYLSHCQPKTQHLFNSQCYIFKSILDETEKPDLRNCHRYRRGITVSSQVQKDNIIEGHGLDKTWGYYILAIMQLNGWIVQIKWSDKMNYDDYYYASVVGDVRHAKEPERLTSSTPDQHNHRSNETKLKLSNKMGETWPRLLCNWG